MNARSLSRYWQTCSSGAYEPEENILRLWYERPVDLRDEAAVVAFFDEVETLWIRGCPEKPWLLVNYRTVRIAPAMTSVFVVNTPMRP